MGNEQVTDTNQTGSEQTPEQKAAEAEATAAAFDTAEEPTEEQKAEAAKAAEEAAKAEAAKKAKREEESTYKKINRTIRELKDETKSEREARHAAELEAARLKGQLEVLQQGKGGEQKPDPNAEPVEPKMEDFETQADFQSANNKYIRDVRAWDRRQIQADLDKKLATVARSTTTLGETPEQKQERETAEKIGAAMEKVREEIGDDAVEVLTARPQDTEFRCTNLMRDTILEKDNAHKILGYAAENPKVFAKIAAMPLAAQVREIDKLAASIGVKKETKATPPVSQVDGKGGSGAVDESKMTDAEYGAYRRKQKLSSA